MADRQEFELGLGKLSRNPGVRPTMKAFTAVHETALADGALSRKTKELMATAISVTQHCEGCIAWHVHGALAAGATADEVGEAVAVAVLMGGGPATYYGAMAMDALETTNADG